VFDSQILVLRDSLRGLREIDFLC